MINIWVGLNCENMYSEVTLIVEEYRKGIECGMKSCAAINIRSIERNFLPERDAV
jgi:hypothetical protein